MESAIFLSVREKATRLPKKVLREIQGRRTVEHLIDRLKLSREPNRIVLCTSVHPDDTILVDIAEANGIKAFRGSEEDKLDRYLRAAERYDVEFMAIVDGDDLFCDPDYIDRTIRAYRETRADYIQPIGLPIGAACFGIARQALARVCELKAERDTEVWTGYFTDTGLFRVHFLEAEEPELRRPEVRMTLDYPEDLEFFEAVFARLYRPGRTFALRDVMRLLSEHPEIEALNRDVGALYQEHLRAAAPVRLKSRPAS